MPNPRTSSPSKQKLKALKLGLTLTIQAMDRRNDNIFSSSVSFSQAVTAYQHVGNNGRAENGLGAGSSPRAEGEMRGELWLGPAGRRVLDLSVGGLAWWRSWLEALRDFLWDFRQLAL